MRFSKKVALTGLAVGLLGILSSDDVNRLAGFIIIAAGCVCQSIEDHKKGDTQ